MRAISFCAAVFCVFFACPNATTALIISTPTVLTTGLNRINFTKQAGDPPGASFNIMQPSNGTRLVSNVLLSAGFVRVNIQVLPGKYDIVAFNNETSAALASTDDFAVVAAPQTPVSSKTAPSIVKSTASAGSTPKATATKSKPSASALISGSEVAAETGVSSTSVSTSSKPPLPVGAIVGIVIGVLALVTLLLLLFLFLRRRAHRVRRRVSYGSAVLETPGPMVQSSLSLTSRSYPFSPSDTSSAASTAQQRRQHITNEMRIVRKQMAELRTVNGPSRSSSVPPTPALSSPASITDSSALDLEHSRRKNDKLQSRIAELEAQLQSAWALGLSDDPPPGYVA